MHWRFEPLFSLTALHQNVVDNPPLDAAGYRYEFSVIPSASSLNRFRQLGWVTKPTNSGLLVFAEKTVRADGSDFVRKTPLSDEVFSFYIQLNRPDILNFTQPFAKLSNGEAVPNDDLPAFSGQGRIVYLNTLGAPSFAGADNETIHRLSANEFVDTAELASRSLVSFILRTEDVTRKRIVASPVGFDAPEHKLTFDVPAAARTVALQLPENAWKIEQQPQGSTEQIYTSERPLPAKIFGIIQVFNTDEWMLSQFRRYQALFTRVR